MVIEVQLLWEELKETRRRSTIEKAWANDIHARCTQEVILLKAMLYLINKRFELLKDRVD